MNKKYLNLEFSIKESFRRNGRQTFLFSSDSVDPLLRELIAEIQRQLGIRCGGDKYSHYWLAPSSSGNLIGRLVIQMPTHGDDKWYRSVVDKVLNKAPFVDITAYQALSESLDLAFLREGAAGRPSDALTLGDAPAKESGR